MNKKWVVVCNDIEGDPIVEGLWDSFDDAAKYVLQGHHLERIKEEGLSCQSEHDIVTLSISPESGYIG